VNLLKFLKLFVCIPWAPRAWNPQYAKWCFAFCNWAIFYQFMWNWLKNWLLNQTRQGNTDLIITYNYLKLC